MQKLLVDMDYANDQDHQAIADKTEFKMNRFSLLAKLTESMLKKTNQDEFLKLRGLNVIEKWLLQNPDGSCPPF